MTVINQTGLPTLLDVTRTLDPNGQVARIAEVLTANCPLIQRMPWKEANGIDGHLLTLRSALPGLTWRKFNQGVLPSKGTTSQFTETCGMLEGWSNVDKKLAERNGNEAAYRATVDMAFVASYRRTLETAFFYQSSKTDPHTIMGLAPRLDALTGIPYATQVLPHDASPSGNDQASIWLLGFGENKVYGIYPKGSAAGLKMTDMGLRPIEDADGGEFLGYKSHFSWDCGLAVEDARYVVRIPNIDATNLVGTGSTLINKMIQATEQLFSLEDCQPVFFMNRAIRTYLRQQTADTTKYTLQFDEVGGRPMMKFMGIPIERTDALINTEAPLA